MKHKHLIGTLIALTLICASLEPPLAWSAKRAVVVAVEEYQEDGFNNLSGCINDGKAIVKILKTHLGFSDSEIRYLQDRAATRQGVLNALDWLVTETRPADQVFFYYAGHGHFAKDDNGDETDEKPARDETLCPYDTDSSLMDDPVRKGNMITDDEIGLRLKQMPGRKIVMIFDSCHSGTATRGMPGNKEQPVRALPLKNPDSRSFGGIRPDKDLAPDGTGVNAMSEEIDDSESFMVFLAAASPHQFAQELPDKEHGALTYGIIQAFAQHGKATRVSDAKSAYNALQSQYGFLANQTPQIEGNPVLAETSLYEIFNASQGQSIAQAVQNDPPSVNMSLTASLRGRETVDFNVGDPVRFRFSATSDGYLYLFDYIEATNQMYLLFPNKWSWMGRGRKANQVRRNQPVWVPPDKVKGVPINFELEAAPPGTERIMAILTPTPWEEMDAIVGDNREELKQLTETQKTRLMELMARKQSGRHLEYDPEPEANQWGPGEWAGTSLDIRIWE